MWDMHRRCTSYAWVKAEIPTTLKEKSVETKGFHCIIHCYVLACKIL